ncbi:hypothetical protein [Haladaptatus sp. CMAA 1911]|uniref:hypothetical protein n=1 Tax=unclassified Haladaptatus TaxID=2622732 RepID=UPI00375439A4
MPGSLVYQHHPANKHYSLEDVKTDPRKFDVDQNDDTKIIGYPLSGGLVYVLYTPGVAGTADDLDQEVDPESLTEILEPMDPDDRVVTIWLLRFFTEMHEEELDGGDGLPIYKEIEIDRVPDALEQVTWEGTVTEVAGQLMSNLILKHSLPNANHRTGITIAETYLEAAGAEIELPNTHTPDYEWQQWVNPYIEQSKIILTVRRHNLYFRTLEEHGCEIVRRKGGIDIPLAEYELDMPYYEAWEIYAEHHEEVCINFVEELIAQSGDSTLQEQPALAKDEFIEFLNTENQSS